MRRGAILVLFAVSLAAPLGAAGKSQGYVSVGAGATDLDGGFDWVIADGPIGIGGEAGAGWAFLGAFTGSFHVPGRLGGHDVFATLGYATLGSSEFSAHGATIGGGAVYWAAPRIGVRFDGFRFLPVSTDYSVPAEHRSSSRYWGVRAGVAFRFR